MKKSLFVLFALAASAQFLYADVVVDGIKYSINTTTHKATVVKGQDAGLTRVIIPESFKYESDVYAVTSIAEEALRGSSITFLSVPASVTSVGDNAFGACANLDTVMWNAIDCNNFSNYQYAPFYHYMMMNAKVKKMFFGPNVHHVPAYLCYNMNQVDTVVLPASVQTIGNDAFRGCSNLKVAILPEELTNLGSQAFSGCSKLDSVNTLGKLTIIPSNAFNSCYKLMKIMIPDGVTSIGDNAFYQTGLKKIIIPNTVATMGDAPFGSCGSLDSVVWNAVSCTMSTAINASPFYDASYISVKSFTFGDAVEVIPQNLCYEMSLLDTIIIPATVTSIGQSAFNGCTGFKEVVLPEGLASLASSAFNGCTNLKKINLPSGLTTIPAQTFYNCPIDSIIIPEGVATIGKNAFSKTALTTVTIPSTVTSLGDAPFDGCAALDSVVWKAVNTTSSSATNTWPFYNCSALRVIVFEKGVTNIPNMACWGASSLAKIYNYSKTPQTIYANVFTNVNKTTCELHVPADGLEEYKAADVWKDFFDNGKLINDLPADQPTAVEDAMGENNSATKILRNGQVVIIRDHKQYNVLGAEL